MFTYTLFMKEPNGRKFSIRGTGNSAADAKNEATAKAAMTVGTVSSAKLTQDDNSYPSTYAASGSYSDVALTLLGADLVKKGIHLENITNDVASLANDGSVDVHNSLIVAFAGSYRDGNGNGGYSAYQGHFVK